MLAAETGHLEVVCWLHKLVLNLAVEVVARPPCRISVGRGWCELACFGDNEKSVRCAARLHGSA